MQEGIVKFQYEDDFKIIREEFVSRIKNTDSNKIYFPTKIKRDSWMCMMVATTIFVLTFLCPLFLNHLEWSNYFEKQNLFYHLNISLQLATIVYFLLYPIYPNISIAYLKNNINKYTSFINENFRSESQFIWYAKRANHTIGQFGRWWKFLLGSFLLLYLFYYTNIVYQFVVGEVNNQYSVILSDIEIIINGTEAFFLFVIYKIFSGKTFVTDSTPKIDFKSQLNYHKQFFFLQILLIIFLSGCVIWSDSGIFLLINRILSSIYIALGFTLLTSHLGKEVFNAKKWELQIFYSYAVMQVLFVVFDKTAFQFMFHHVDGAMNSTKGDHIRVSIDTYFNNIKTITFYIVLIFRTYLFYFIKKAFKSNRLFTYFMLNSKRVETQSHIEDFRDQLV